MVCGHGLKFRNLHQQFTNPHESFRCAQILFPLTASACCLADGNSFSSSHSHAGSKQQLHAYWAHVNFTPFFFFFWGGTRNIFLFFFSDLTLFSCSSCVTSKPSNLRVISAVPQNKRIKNTSNHSYTVQFWGRSLNNRSLQKVACFPIQWSLVSQEREKTMRYSAINVYPLLIWAIWSLPISCTHTHTPTPNRF